MQQGSIHIGISGWRYKGWRGQFYPSGLAQRRELEFAAARFSSIEINGTFYSLQRPAFFRRWSSETPPSFLFSAKGPRFITHMLKLRHAERPLANFFASGLLELGPKLGPILWQFPPQLGFDVSRFATFFDLLPRTHGAAASLAQMHDPRLKDRAATVVAAGVPTSRPLRHCVEIRHASFVTPEFIALLRRYKIGLVVADTVAWPLLVDVTSNFVYCRLHGSEELYASGYESDALDIWADRVVAWARGAQAAGPLAGPVNTRHKPADVFVYFDNDIKVRAPFDALSLQAKVDERLARP